MIYDFGKTSGAVDQAKATVKRQQAMVLKELQSIEQQTAEAVISAHRLQVLVGIASQQVDAVKKVYEMSKLRADAGVSTRSDPIQAETRVQSAQANLIEVRAQYAQARQRLRTLLGGPFDGDIADLPDAQAAQVQMTPTPDTSLVPDVLAAQADALVAKDQLSVAKANRLPTVSLDYTLNKNLTGVNATTLVPRGSDHSLMVNLSWTMYQGGALNAQVKSASYALDAARSRVDVARLNSSDQARGYREQALGAKDRAPVMNSRKQSIAETRDLYREQYKLGTRSILDLLNSEQEFYQAASDEATAQHDYWMALVGYVGATGSGNEFYELDPHTVAQLELRP
jgi:adhesin transport system outer membrane protein